MASKYTTTQVKDGGGVPKSARLKEIATKKQNNLTPIKSTTDTSKTTGTNKKRSDASAGFVSGAVTGALTSGVGAKKSGTSSITKAGTKQKAPIKYASGKSTITKNGVSGNSSATTTSGSKTSRKYW